MSVKVLKNRAASVHQRLLNIARESNRPFNELLQYYAIERFLYRLSVSPHGKRFVLKGALMLTAWKAPKTRPTMDIDLLSSANNALENIERIVRDVCTQPVPEDGLRFSAATVTSERIKEDADYEGVRLRFTGNLGNARVPMQIDVAFGDVITPGPRKTTYPTILGDPCPQLKGYNRESAVAEKFQAMVNLGDLNTRMKDFFDIWFLSHHFRFNGRALLAACRRTFTHRHTKCGPEPLALGTDFAGSIQRQTMWSGFLRKNRVGDAPKAFTDTVAALRLFLLPMAQHLALESNFTGSWPPGGPWSTARRKRGS